jgi:hypothetical protein
MWEEGGLIEQDVSTLKSNLLTTIQTGKLINVNTIAPKFVGGKWD